MNIIIYFKGEKKLEATAVLDQPSSGTSSYNRTFTAQRQALRAWLS